MGTSNSFVTEREAEAFYISWMHQQTIDALRFGVAVL